MVLGVTIDEAVYTDRTEHELNPQHMAGNIPKANEIPVYIPSHPHLNKRLGRSSSETP